MIKWSLEKLAKWEPLKKQVKKLVNDPAYALRFLIAANAAKDAINCGFYVTQSLNNKDIPEEKRKFVAALDAANGILMIASQIVLGFGFTSKKVQDKICNKLFGNVEENATNFVNGRILSHPVDFTGDVRMRLKNAAKSIPLNCKKGFTAISTLVITSIIAKRIIVPLIATPMASWIKKNYMDDKNKKPDAIKNVNNMPNPVSAMPQFAKQNAYTAPKVGSFENFNNFAQKGVMFHY